MGLFSRRSYGIGDHIFTITGCVIHRRNRSVDEAIQYPNAVGLGTNRWIDPPASNPLRFINHSCNANAGYREDRRVVALRAIRAGHELTLDYSITESDLHWDFTPQAAGGGADVAVQSAEGAYARFSLSYPLYSVHTFPLYQRRSGWRTADSERADRRALPSNQVCRKSVVTRLTRSLECDL